MSRRETWDAAAAGGDALDDLAGPPLPGCEGSVELTVATAGHVPLPREVAELVGLAPGDVVAIEKGPAALHLETFRSYLESLAAQGLAPAEVVRRLAAFRRRPLGVVTAAEELPVPPALLPLAPGDEVVLQVAPREDGYALYLFKDDR
jgi:hypothetical protein